MTMLGTMSSCEKIEERRKEKEKEREREGKKN